MRNPETDTTPTTDQGVAQIYEDVDRGGEQATRVETFDLLREKINQNDYYLTATAEQCRRDLEKEMPNKPATWMFKLLISAGRTEAEAHDVAVISAQREFLDNKANAEAALEYCTVLKTPGTELESIPYLQKALVTYRRQFTEMGRCLGLDLSQPSKLEPGLSIEENYGRNVTPIPRKLTGVFFDENTQATVLYQPSWVNKDKQWGSYFSFSVEYDENASKLVVKHDQDHTKIHEDSHFLAAAMKGERGYFHDYRLGMVGEGFAPIFELWFAGSLKSDHPVLTEDVLNVIDGGDSPVVLRNSSSNPSEPEWWNEAKTEMVIREHSGTTSMSAEIMKLLQNNPDVKFAQLYRSFLEAGDLAEFLQKIAGTGATKGLEEFTSTMVYLSELPRS